MDTSPYHIAISLLWLLCTIMLNSVTCSLKVHCNEKDVNALQNFKQGVTNPSTLLSSWFTEKDCCQWMGVQCDNTTGRVTKLNLPCQTIPSTYGDKDDKSHCLTVDLSSNNLSGRMPLELFMLTRMQSLNLSHNQLVGMIPQEISNLKQLESLDLSSNRFSGQIPKSMSSLSFLGVLNLSFNNFEGKIPSGTQLQGFTNLSYMGNPNLCGPPLTKNCPQDEKMPNIVQMGDDDEEDESKVHSWFFMGLGIGFATGYWGVLGAIFFNKRCRHAYFRFLGQLYDMVILKMNFVYWSLKNCNSGN